MRKTIPVTAALRTNTGTTPVPPNNTPAVPATSKAGHAKAGAAPAVVLDVDIKDKKQLQAVYMPFLVNGGVFVPSVKAYEMGDTVYLQLHLLKDGGVYPVVGQVAWITPKHAVYKRMQGIGVHFADNDEMRQLKRTIEELLASAAQPGKPTHTL